MFDSSVKLVDFSYQYSHAEGDLYVFVVTAISRPFNYFGEKVSSVGIHTSFSLSGKVTKDSFSYKDVEFYDDKGYSVFVSESEYREFLTKSSINSAFSRLGAAIEKIRKQAVTADNSLGKCLRSMPQG